MLTLGRGTTGLSFGSVTNLSQPETLLFEQSSTQREITDSKKVFSTLIRSIETRQVELTEVMEEKQKAVEKRAEGLIKDLEQELTELQNRNSQLENLSQTEDHLYFLQVTHSYDYTTVTDCRMGVYGQCVCVCVSGCVLECLCSVCK